MFRDFSAQLVRIFTLGIIMGMATQIQAGPKPKGYIPQRPSSPGILNPILRQVYNALQKRYQGRYPAFDEQLKIAQDNSNIDLVQYPIDSPERTVLAWGPIRTIGAVARLIVDTCNEDATCIEKELNGELGEFIDFMLNPGLLKKENESTSQRFHELYTKHAYALDLAGKPSSKPAQLDLEI
jgi:hypothetical protein